MKVITRDAKWLALLMFSIGIVLTSCKKETNPSTSPVQLQTLGMDEFEFAIPYQNTCDPHPGADHPHFVANQTMKVEKRVVGGKTQFYFANEASLSDPSWAHMPMDYHKGSGPYIPIQIHCPSTAEMDNLPENTDYGPLTRKQLQGVERLQGTMADAAGEEHLVFVFVYYDGRDKKFLVRYHKKIGASTIHSGHVHPS